MASAATVLAQDGQSRLLNVDFAIKDVPSVSAVIIF